MRIALTGVSGFLGSYIAKRLHHAGHSITGLVRGTSRRDHIETFVDRLVVGEQSDQNCWPELLQGADCVIHNSVDWGPIEADDLAAHLRSNLNGSIALLQASAPRQFIFISTIAVHHDMRPRWKGLIDEDHPLRPAGVYGAYKAAVEAHLWAAHFAQGRHTCAIRPCGVYGIDPRLERSHGFALIQKIKRGQPVNKPGGGKFVHVEDVAAAVVAAVGNAAAAGQPYNLVDCYARWGDWAVIAAELLDAKVKIDLSSAAQPKNTFLKDAAQSLGVALNRGHDGIRAHLRELLERMQNSGDL